MSVILCSRRYPIASSWLTARPCVGPPAGRRWPGAECRVPCPAARRATRTRASGPASARFTRADADLWHDLHIQAPDAALGVTAAVPVPEGQARVRVPPRTQPGSVLRVEGRGPPRYGGYGRSSLNLTVILDIPRQLSARQRRALRAAPGRGCRENGHGGRIPRAGRSPIRPEDNSRCGRAARREPEAGCGSGSPTEPPWASRMVSGAISGQVCPVDRDGRASRCMAGCRWGA